uniref:SFRICE_005158 n=1 Tax=Spodoptera frugiperda TaxID=7108 RepID=A0A2H1VA12_SPOFR
MSEETERHGEASCDVGAGGGGSSIARVLMTPLQLDAAAADSLRAAWRNQDLYIDHLETLNKQLEGEDEEMVLSRVREVPVECLVEVQLSAESRVMSPDDPGAVSMFSDVALPSVTEPAEWSGLCSHEKSSSSPQTFLGSLEKAKEVEDRIKQQYAESQHREKVLVRRLAAKEQEIQDYVSQITELKSSHASLNGRPTLLDPAVNVLILRLKQELTSTKARLEETQNELSAWKFTPDSNTGKKLMAKCRLLHQENEDLGRMTSSGRIAKLEGDLALQKSFSEEVKKSQSELDEFLQELDEDVEGMQSTVLFLQQELRASHATVNGTRTASRAASPEKRTYSGSDCSDTPPGKRRRASVLSLDYNEDEEPLTVPNGDAD